MTTITWQELAELHRDRAILDWVDADFARHSAIKGGMSLRMIVGDLLDAGEDLTKTLAEACRSLATRRRATTPRADPPAGP